MMPMHAAPTPMTPQQVASAVAGSPIQFAARVDSVDRATVHAHVLNKIGDETYQSSPQTIDIYQPKTVSYVMGKRDEVKPGAVLFVYAVATKPHQADATKIVIDTRYVTVK